MKPQDIPTAEEIMKAREQVDAMFPKGYAPFPVEPMELWAGEGWHKTEVFTDILVGMQIIENRIGPMNAKPPKKLED